MERPVMNPMFMQDSEPAPKPPKPKLWRVVLAFVWRLVKRVAKAFAATLLAWPGGQQGTLRVEDGTPLQRAIRGILYRLAFVPIVLVMFVAGLVFYVTHPSAKPPEADPGGYGMYYESVQFTADDGVSLDAWLVPVLNARKVVAEQERALFKRDPAIVLVHDMGANKQQMLPIVRPLHDAGMVVMIVGLRGSAPGSRVGQTFGAKEAADVRAAVGALRARSYVDPARIAIMGLGTGANAALAAGQGDPSIAALVIDSPIDGFDEAFAARVGSDKAWVRWLRPLFKWTFEIMYHVDADTVELVRYVKGPVNKPILRFSGRDLGVPYEPRNAAGITRFLRVHGLGEKQQGQQVAGARD
jgi:hypothetical protein